VIILQRVLHRLENDGAAGVRVNAGRVVGGGALVQVLVAGGVAGRGRALAGAAQILQLGDVRVEVVVRKLVLVAGDPHVL